MRNSIKTWWLKDKEKAEGGGTILLLFGVVLLIISCGLALIPNYDELWLVGISIGVISIALGFIAIGMSAKSDRYVKIMLSTIKGEISQQFSAEFDLARIINKVKLTKIGSEYAIYNSNENMGKKDVPFYFSNAVVFLNAMKENDIVRLRMYIYKDGEKYQISGDEENTFKGKQAGAVKIDGGFYNQEGIEITAEHISAELSPLEICCYAYDAARGN